MCNALFIKAPSPCGGGTSICLLHLLPETRCLRLQTYHYRETPKQISLTGLRAPGTSSHYAPYPQQGTILYDQLGSILDSSQGTPKHPVPLPIFGCSSFNLHLLRRLVLPGTRYFTTLDCSSRALWRHHVISESGFIGEADSTDEAGRADQARPTDEAQLVNNARGTVEASGPIETRDDSTERGGEIVGPKERSAVMLQMP